jgi:hypothetical protein
MTDSLKFGCHYVFQVNPVLIKPKKFVIVLIAPHNGHCLESCKSSRLQFLIPHFPKIHIRIVHYKLYLKCAVKLRDSAPLTKSMKPYILT